MQKIVFILPTYPEVMCSFLLSFVKECSSDVEIVCLNGLLEEREGLYEKNELFKHARVVFYNKEKELDKFLNEIIIKNKDAIFVFGGFLGSVGRALRLYHLSGGEKAFIITEKPSVRPVKIFNKIVRFLKNLKVKYIYGKAYKAVATSIKAVLVTGEKGVYQLQKVGVPKEKLYNFMYTHIEEEILPVPHFAGNTVKFVYVGRFNYLNRGMDNLINAFDKLSKNNWTLDLVGGYGEDAEKIISWAKKKTNVNYIGAWKSNQVINNLQNYDVCVSPTRIDGWRIQVNQAIMAGVGTVTTEEAISDELVKASKTGMVVNAFKKRDLYKAISYIVNHPQVVEEWKKNCDEYKQRISNKNIAQYVIKIIEYCLSKDEKIRPRCPWL